MSTWTVLRAPVPEDLSSPDAWALHGAARVSHAYETHLWGHADLSEPPEYLASHLRPNEYSDRRMYVAVAADAEPVPDAVAGYAKIIMPLKDNTHLAHVELYVAPAHAGAGVATSLLGTVEEVATAAGRTTVVAWSEHGGEPPADAPGVLEPPTGSGRIAAGQAAVRLAARHGYELEQAERYSVLHLPVADDHLARLHAEAAARAGGDYRLHSWTDRSPDAWVDQVAVLETRMSTDTPQAGLDMEEATWDAARVRRWEAERAEADEGYLLVAAEHVPTGTLAAFTVVLLPRKHPEIVFQEDTLVLREHRGRRLGMLVKADLLRRLREARPEARRIHTWNAEENSYMLAINVALGFRPTGVIGAWQKRVAPDAVGVTGEVRHRGSAGEAADAGAAAAAATVTA